MRVRLSFSVRVAILVSMTCKGFLVRVNKDIFLNFRSIDSTFFYGAVISTICNTVSFCLKEAYFFREDFELFGPKRFEPSVIVVRP